MLLKHQRFFTLLDCQSPCLVGRNLWNVENRRRSEISVLACAWCIFFKGEFKTSTTIELVEKDIKVVISDSLTMTSLLGRDCVTPQAGAFQKAELTPRPGLTQSYVGSVLMAQHYQNLAPTNCWPGFLRLCLPHQQSDVCVLVSIWSRGMFWYVGQYIFNDLIFFLQH